MKKVIILITLLLMSLTGCTIEAERIYVVCKQDSATTYVYDTNNNFYELINGDLVPHSGVALKAYPALTIEPYDCEYNIVPVLPGLYRGTLESLSGYLFKLLKDNGEFEIVSRDWNNIEIIVKTDEVNTRLIFNISGDIRIYAEDNFHNSIEPLYLNKE